MPVFSKIYNIRHLLATVILLPLLCACSSNDSDDIIAPEIANSNHFINLNIVVSAGNEGFTRATPEGGEDGDGREVGFQRENHVEGITFMLYRDDDGINTQNEETKIAYVQYYEVEPILPRETQGTENKTDEVIYTTGDQPLMNSGLDLTAKYHAIVVANKDLTDEIVQDQTTVADVREMVIENIYTTDNNGIAATNFVMASEKDAEIAFNVPSNIISKGGKTYFTFDKIYIERLAARVDFWMKGAVYNDDYNGTAGYVYDVEDCNDKFVLTSITPFNLYNADEYYIKHVNNGDSKIQYLVDETKNTFVIDPKTNDKEGTSPNYYDNPLANLVKDDNFVANAGEYRQMTKVLHDNKDGDKSQYASFTGVGSADNFILCYPKENTLKYTSLLYYYATGVAIEGYYYKVGSDEVEHCIYYGYLRHQGEPFDNGNTHTIRMAKDLNPTDDVGADDVPMNFGVVRNNIYRISIDRIESKGIVMKLEVKKWDKFTHKTIFM